MKGLIVTLLLVASASAAAVSRAGGGPAGRERHWSQWDDRKDWKDYGWPDGDEYGLPPVSGAALEATISTEALSTKAHELEDIAYSTPDRNRVIGSEGHKLTVEWISSYFDEMSDYYTYELQSFETLFALSEGTLTIFGNEVGQAFEFSPGGNVDAAIVAVDNVGCDASDYPDAADGSIALISRGTCEFGEKSALAGAAGAVAAIIYNDVAGPIGGGTLGPPPRPEGDYVPTISIAKDKGERILEALDAGSVTGAIDVTADIRNVTVSNVIAQTIGGDPDNVLMLGAHSDSVYQGPGINDDGSGVIGILETAIQLSNFSTTNAVRFGFWAAEEQGLIGSTHYVEKLNNSAAAIDKIRLYLNFDMIASPNYIYGIFDGDGDAYDIKGPPGSARVEHFYERWFDAQGLGHVPTAFDGRSDYQAFSENGIACGGLFSGADMRKTAKEVELFGGEQGVIHDPNYHTALDNYANLNFTSFTTLTRGIAASVAKYGTSFASLPAQGNKVKRDVQPALEDKRLRERGHHKVWIA